MHLVRQTRGKGLVLRAQKLSSPRLISGVLLHDRGRFRLSHLKSARKVAWGLMTSRGAYLRIAPCKTPLLSSLANADPFKMAWTEELETFDIVTTSIFGAGGSDGGVQGIGETNSTDWLGLVREHFEQILRTFWQRPYQHMNQ